MNPDQALIDLIGEAVKRLDEVLLPEESFDVDLSDIIEELPLLRREIQGHQFYSQSNYSF